MDSSALYSVTDMMGVMVWTFTVALIFLCVGYCMGKRETGAEVRRKIVEIFKPHEPENEPDGDFWDEHVPTAINERGRRE